MSEEEEIIDKLKNHTDYNSYEDYEKVLKLIDLFNKEKEKNKELENCLQMAKQIMTADISEDFDCMKLKEFKEYLLNEIKLNENFEE